MQDDKTIDAFSTRGLKQAKMYDNPNALVAEQEAGRALKLQYTPRAPQVMADADRGHLVRGRETIEDRMRGEQVGPE